MIMTVAALWLIAPAGGGSSLSAAPWLAPAAQERLAADWVKEIAAQFRTERVREVFMNAPFGSPQSSMLGLLNDAAVALKEGEIDYARDLIHHAVGLLDDGVEHGWYSRRDIEPIKGMILSRAMEGIQQARKSKGVTNQPVRQRERSGPTAARSDKDFDEPLFGGPDDYDLYGEEGRRWTGYTRGRLGLTEQLEERRGAREKDRTSARDARRARGGTSARSERAASRSSADFERARRDDPRDLDWDRLGPRSRDRVEEREAGDRERIRRTDAMRPKPSARDRRTDVYDEDRWTPEERERRSRTSQRMSREDVWPDEGAERDRRHRRADE
ncbi:hypothetical protein [Candidatus Nitrospira bockiana]